MFCQVNNGRNLTFELEITKKMINFKQLKQLNNGKESSNKRS